MENSQKEIEDFIDHFDEQMRHAIGLMEMHMRSCAPEVVDLIYNTRFDWGYAKIQQSLLFELVLVLCRFYDADDRSKSFPTIFNHEAIGTQPHEWFSGLPQSQLDLFHQAKGKWLKVKGGHQLSRVREVLRHKFWAHTDIKAQEELSRNKNTKSKKTGKKIQLPKFEYVDELCAETQSIVSDLGLAILNRDPNFEDTEQIWGQHAQLFFDMLKMGKETLDEESARRLAQLGGTEKALAPIPRRKM